MLITPEEFPQRSVSEGGHLSLLPISAVNKWPLVARAFSLQLESMVGLLLPPRPQGWKAGCRGGTKPEACEELWWVLPTGRLLLGTGGSVRQLEHLGPGVKRAAHSLMSAQGH